MADKVDITLTINGRAHAIRVEPRKTLVDAIRDDCGQTGTHIGCEHGVCGTCTVILDGEAVRSCLMFAVQAQGKKIRTVEGLGTPDNLHPLQRAFIAHHGLQCGFCTPGFLMLATNALEHEPLPLHRLPEHHQGRARRARRTARREGRDMMVCEVGTLLGFPSSHARSAWWGGVRGGGPRGLRTTVPHAPPPPPPQPSPRRAKTRSGGGSERARQGQPR